MKKISLLGLLVAIAISVQAYDFTYTYEDMTLYYEITDPDAKTVKVVPQRTSVESTTGVYYDSSYPSGKHVVIPEKVEGEYGDGYEWFTVTGIGDYAFYATTTSSSSYKEYILSVIIPRTVKTIGNHAFSGAFHQSSASSTKVTPLTIPENVEMIGSYAFTDELDITWLAKNCTIDQNAFSSYTIRSVTFGTMVEKVPAYLFYNNIYITNITLPYNVKEIGDYAFFQCKNLSKIGMGESMEKIGNHAFNGCVALEYIVCAAPVPPVVEPYAFIDVPIDATMEVPCGKVADYAQADEWKYFWYFAETILYKASVLVEDDTQGSATVDYNCAEAVFHAAPASSYKFKQWSNGMTQNPLTLPLNGDITLVAYFENMPQGLDQLMDENAGNATKILMDGQLFIRRNGAIYTLSGSQVR